MTFRERRVVKIISVIASHTELLHEPLRANVARRRERHDLIKVKPDEPVGHRSTGGFGRQNRCPSVGV
jgi:hypothetical protein